MHRVAKARAEAEAEAFRRDLSLHYLNAKLQRAQKMPSLKKLVGDKPKPTLKSISAAFHAAPTFKPTDG